MGRDSRTVADLGELALIERIVGRLGGRPPPAEIWSGDDAAVLETTGRVLLTTDLMVEHVDFDLGYATGGDIGWKAIAVNASDLAAMGGSPGHAVATLALHPSTPVDTVDGITLGLAEAAERWSVALVGGDISSASELSIGVTMLGTIVERAPVLRSGARPGDALCVTGALGGAAGGLIALRAGLEGEAARRLGARQLRPRALVAEGAALARLGVTAMIDLSDGLAMDLGHLVDSSGVGCEVALEDVPVDGDLAWLAAQEGVVADPVLLALEGGEDFELLFTLDEALVGRAVRELGELGTAVTRIGTVTESARLMGGRDLEEWRRKGWEHLRGP